MSLAASRILATKAIARRAPAQQQKRGIVDYLTNYPDRVPEMKKIQCAGGTLQGEKNPSWLKQPGDKMWAGAALALGTIGVVRVGIAMYRLATGKGKIED
eukprot:CAMPEP_0117045184 /NCGR_PEP_ID=MMETSP0472-20121206/31264_1 /TAXON_ID=693140 ORGANISM="Tiarina fusus, Strain LIS" /NCGR_SAMPLE_ID=MMETSP0472 /ASSEMBLY_ACC=CAM_ASM_000603 /LENGTH=99 /DNA_ID=CAMNT_0004757099 /DNA_START=46 /DNA_END=345 /DNA_ORIENTATION=+